MVFTSDFGIHEYCHEFTPFCQGEHSIIQQPFLIRVGPNGLFCKRLFSKKQQENRMA